MRTLIFISIIYFSVGSTAIQSDPGNDDLSAVIKGIKWAETRDAHIVRGKVAYNKKTKATGIMQITPVCLQHFNFRTGRSWTMTDMSNQFSNEVVGYSHYSYLLGLGMSREAAANAYNMGHNSKRVNTNYLIDVFGNDDFLIARRVYSAQRTNGKFYVKLWPPL